MNKKIKNIIFDLNGVIFQYNTASELIKLKNGTIINPIIPLEKGFEILKELHKQKNNDGHRIYKLFACTNWKNPFIDFLKANFSSIMDLFDGIVTPDLSNAKKPDHRMFKFLIEKYDLKADQCLFLDDQPLNVQSAENLNITTIHVNDIEMLGEKLRQLLSKNN